MEPQSQNFQRLSQIRNQGYPNQPNPQYAPSQVPGPYVQRKFCIKCAGEMKIGINGWFCPNCGYTNTSQQENKETQGTLSFIKNLKKTIKLVIILKIVSIIIIGIIVIIAAKYFFNILGTISNLGI